MDNPVSSGIRSYNNAVTPSDTDLLSVAFGEDKKVTKGIVTTSGGAVELLFADDEASIVLTLNAGEDYPYNVKQVLAAGTVATGIYALY